MLSLSAPIGTKTESKYTDNPSIIDLVLTNEVVQVLSVMLHSVRATIVLLPLNIVAIWITPNRKKDHKTDFNRMRKRLVLSNWTEKFMIHVFNASNAENV